MEFHPPAKNAKPAPARQVRTRDKWGLMATSAPILIPGLSWAADRPSRGARPDQPGCPALERIDIRFSLVIPAKAGIQLLQMLRRKNKLDPRFRGGDDKKAKPNKRRPLKCRTALPPLDMIAGGAVGIDHRPRPHHRRGRRPALLLGDAPARGEARSGLARLVHPRAVEIERRQRPASLDVRDAVIHEARELLVDIAVRDHRKRDPGLGLIGGAESVGVEVELGGEPGALVLWPGLEVKPGVDHRPIVDQDFVVDLLAEGLLDPLGNAVLRI